MKKIDKNYILIILTCLIAIIICSKQNYLFGSTTDWLAQHIAFPDYFRNLFYETHNFFPSLALNIGAGQNIYYFSYYGLLNPIILLSYLLPFIDMTTYIISSNIILYILFGLFMYKWLKKHYEKNMSMLLAIISLLASPVLFHFHRHFMFVNYLPFLILGLIGIDKYIEKNKPILLIISVFMIITTSYYYSITGILTLFIYYIYKYLEENDLNIKKLILNLVKLSIPIIISVLLSAVLIIPTLLALLDGRDTGASINIINLLIPKLNIDSIIYGNYTMGLTGIAVISMLYMFKSKEKKNKFLSIILFTIITIPLLIYLLNGTLYIRDKILIPFIPLFILLVGEFLKEIFDKKIKIKSLILIIIISSIIFILLGYVKMIYYIEIIIIAILTIIYYKKNIKWLLVIYILISSFVSFITANKEEIYVSSELYNNSYNKSIGKEIKSILDNEENIVRFNNYKEPLYSVNKIYDLSYYQTSVYSSTSNSNYKNFYTNIFKNSLGHRNDLIIANNSNIFYQMFMGIKYIYSDYDEIGYEYIGNNTYENDNVLPMFYVSYNTLSEDEFNKIKYPYNLEVLLKNTIVKQSENKTYDTNIEKIDLEYTYENNKNINVQQVDNMYYINAKKNTNINLYLNKPINNKILIITFRVNNQHKCSENDSEIKINNVVNKLTCSRDLYLNNNYVFHYVITSNDEIDKLKVNIKKGLYIIEDINTYVLDYNQIKYIKDNITEAVVDKEKTKGDIIELNVEAKVDGYIVTSLPYDKGYKVYVDNKKEEYEKVNTSFIGFKIDKGNHNIKIVYESNGLFIGKIISLIGLTSLIFYIFIEKRKTV